MCVTERVKYLGSSQHVETVASKTSSLLLLPSDILRAICEYVDDIFINLRTGMQELNNAYMLLLFVINKKSRTHHPGTISGVRRMTMQLNVTCMSV